MNDLRKRINGYEEGRWFYASNLGSDRNAQTTLKQIARESNKIYPNVAFRILDFDELVALNKETKKVGDERSCDVTFRVAKGRGFFVNESPRLFLALVKARVLAEDSRDRMTHTTFKRSKAVEKEIGKAVIQLYEFKGQLS